MRVAGPIPRKLLLSTRRRLVLLALFVVGAQLSLAACKDSPEIFTLTVSGSGTGSGTVASSGAGTIACTITAGQSGGTCSEEVTEGATRALAATPAAGSVFDGWQGACNGSSACSVGMSEDQTVTAGFSLAQTGTLQVNVTGLPGGVNAAVQVSGPGTNQTLTATTTLSNRAPGSYTVTASAVTSGATSYDAVVTGSPAAVVANTTTTSTVAYTASNVVTQLGLVTQPTSAESQEINDNLARAPLSPQPVVELRNAVGLPVAESGRTITASVAPGAGALGTGNLAGTVSQVTNAQGRATFTDLGIEGCGTYTLSFASAGLPTLAATQLTVTSPTGNQPPVPSAHGPYSGMAQQPVTFSRAGSFDPETAFYNLWNFGDGSPVIVLNGVQTTTHSYATAGPYTFTYTMVDLQCKSASATAPVTISPSTGPTITTSTLPNGTVGQGYTQPLAVTGGTAPYTWSATGLPAGLGINASSGVISGTPTAPGPSTVNVTVLATAGGSATRALPLTVTAAVAITTTTLPNGTFGQAYSQPVVATGGTPPYTWSATGLPGGLAINAGTGTISGTPTAAGTSSVTVTAQASAGGSASRTLSLTVVNGASVLTVLGGGAGTGSGQVTSNPAGISCTITNGTAAASGCSSAAFGTGTVILTASTGLLAGWSGEGCTGGGTCPVSMTTPRTVTAAFVPSGSGLFSGKLAQTKYTGGINTNAPVGGASVTFRKIGASTSSVPVTSNADGTYRSPVLTAGNYAITITKTDVRTVTVTKPAIVSNTAPTALATIGVIVSPYAGTSGGAKVRFEIRNNTGATVTDASIALYGGYCLSACEPDQLLETIDQSSDPAISSIAPGDFQVIEYRPFDKWGVWTIVVTGTGFAQVAPYVFVIDNPYGSNPSDDGDTEFPSAYNSTIELNNP